MVLINQLLTGGAPFSEQVITPIISELTLLIILFTFVIAGVLTHLHSLTNWGELWSSIFHLGMKKNETISMGDP